MEQQRLGDGDISINCMNGSNEFEPGQSGANPLRNN